MASSIPSQERFVDPYASYNSNVVNTLTEVVTNGRNGVVTPNSCQVEQTDSTSLIVLTGNVIKDDVLIKVTANHTININDLDQYIQTGPFPAPGYNYIVLDYTYVKSKPPPVATIKILRPGERNILAYVSSYLLLKIVEITHTSGVNTITKLLDFDPENNAMQRETLWAYASTQGLINIHGSNDRGRMVYETSRDKYYFGYNDKWGELAAGGVSLDVNTNTPGVSAGVLCYIDSSKNAVPSIGTSFQTQADIIPTAIASIADGGKAIICGFVSGIQVETGTLVGTGDLVYLSTLEAGKVTSAKPTPIFQLVGRALSNGSVTTPIDMLFFPKIMLTINLENSLELVDWTDASPDGYYATIDVRGLEGDSAYLIQLYDSSTHEQVIPTKVEIIDSGDYIKVWQPAPQELDYIVSGGSSGGGSGGGGGGGGGAVTEHSLLTNLAYNVSGHTGFAPSPHNNTHHSQPFVEVSGVNFTNLNASGSVGPSSTQVAAGNHLHSQYVDVPSESVLLFYNNTAITGYTLLTTVNDAVVYVTPGSVAGGEAGGTYKTGGTWTQPIHSHDLAMHTHDMQSHFHGFTLPSHNHKIWTFTGYMTSAYAFDNLGVTFPITSKAQGKASGNLITDITAADGYTRNTDYYTSNSDPVIAGTTANPSASNTGSGGPSTTGTANTPNTWRPVGINMTLQKRN